MGRRPRFGLVAVQLDRRLIEGRRRPVTTTCEWGFRCLRSDGQGCHACGCCRDGASRCATTWTVRWGLPLVPLAGAATASRSHAQSTVNLVVLSSSARSYGTRGVELWDDSQGRGEGYDRVLVCCRLGDYVRIIL